MDEEMSVLFCDGCHHHCLCGGHRIHVVSIWNLGGSNDVFVRPSAKFLRHHVMGYLGISIIF
jgi:hypothetical protein